ncbi:MAG: hypothetical protein HDS75_02760 [Bacteroidales bacterium]|nr:hypothetical protein [Bacteroidales bacterium]
MDGRRFIKFVKEGDAPMIGEVDQFRNRMTRGGDDLDIELKFVPCAMKREAVHFVGDDGGQGWSALKQNPYIEISDPQITIFSRPDRGDVVTLGAGVVDNGSYSIEDLINGEQEAEEEESGEDLIYIAIAGAMTPETVTTKWKIMDDGKEKEQGPVTVLMPRGFTAQEQNLVIGGSRLDKNEALSLGLNEVAGQTNLYSKTKIGIEVRATEKHCISFISAAIPDVEDIFIIRNRRFVCEKIEASISTHGLNHKITGYFYELTL